MSKLLKRIAFFFSILLLTAFFLPSGSQAKEYYIWNDEAGTVHISDHTAGLPEDHRVVKLPDKPEKEVEEEKPTNIINNIEKIIIVDGEDEKKPKEEPEPVRKKKIKARKCKSLDIREFGLISDTPVDPWTEATLLEKYGPPCHVIHSGEVFFERRRGERRIGRFAEKKQYVYSGDYSDRTSVITIVDGVVVKKERIYD